jgi:hypothetical protein
MATAYTIGVCVCAFAQHQRTWERPQITDADLFQIVVNDTDENAIIAAAAVPSAGSYGPISEWNTSHASNMQGLTGDSARREAH